MTSKGLYAVLAIIAGIVIIADPHQVRSTPPDALDQSQEQPPAAGLKIAMVDAAEVVVRNDRLQKRLGEIKEQMNEFGQQTDALRTQLQELKVEYEQMTPGRPETYRLAELLAAKSAEYAEKRESKRNEIVLQEARAYFDTTKDLREIVAEYARAHRFDLVLNSNPEPDPGNPQAVANRLNEPVLYANAIDITNDIAERMNASDG